MHSINKNMFFNKNIEKLILSTRGPIYLSYHTFELIQVISELYNEVLLRKI